jgi:hypothetical protein
MSSSTTTGPTQLKLDSSDLALRILAEGYGPGAWHGPDLKAALADVTAEAAFRRPSPGRHNIAEIALHRAWCIRSVATRISGENPAAFPLDGSDWFDLSDRGPLEWERIRAEVEQQQGGLTRVAEAIRAGRLQSPLTGAERFELVLGTTCHAVYHAGQVQLIKALAQTG